MNREVINRDLDLNFLATFCIGTGVVRVDKEQLYLPKMPEVRGWLPAPIEEVRNWKIGFDPESEARHLRMVEGIENKKIELSNDVVTQLAEDFGLTEHRRPYDWEEGKLVVREVGSLQELVAKGKIQSEIDAVNRIEMLLRDCPEQVVVHFNPKNLRLNYKYECIDFWRVVDAQPVMIRLMVNQNEKTMRQIWRELNGGIPLDESIDIRGVPIPSKLKISDLLGMCERAERKNDLKYKTISTLVALTLGLMESEYGTERIFKDPELITRLYSVTYRAIEEKLKKNSREVRREINNDDISNVGRMVKARMMGEENKPSYGCTGMTSVQSFAPGEGMIIIQTSDGIKVIKGTVEAGMKYCELCQCYYWGDVCPLCKK